MKMIQVYNGYEFVNDKEKTDRKTAFGKVADKKVYTIKKHIRRGKMARFREAIEKMEKYYMVGLYSDPIVSR